MCAARVRRIEGAEVSRVRKAIATTTGGSEKKMARHGEPTDEAWAWIELLLPEGGRRYGPWGRSR